MVHPGLGWARESAEGREWLDHLPGLVAGCLADWELEAGEPFQYAYASLALPVTRADGTDAVLKLQFPHRESDHEADALEHWAGEGAVRLLARHDERSALLIERCFPGTPLSEESPARALDLLIGLLPRLWKPAGAPFTTLADEAAWWISYLPDSWERVGQPFERRQLDRALDALRDLAATQGEQVLLNQDLHAQNVLAADREPWLVIDPKPLVGEREFGVAPIVRGDELGDSRREVLARFDRLTGELGLDRERARGWTIGQTLAWAFGDAGAHVRHLEVAHWLFEAA